MKKSAMAAIAAVIVIGGGAAIAHPLYTAYVERQVAAWIRAGGGQSTPGTAAFVRLSADVLSNTIVVEGYRFEPDSDTTFEAGNMRIALTDQAVRIDRVEAELETTFFLTPISGIRHLQAVGFDSDWTMVPERGRPVPASLSIGSAEIRDAGLPATPLGNDAASLADVAALVRHERVGQVVLTDVRIDNAELPQPMIFETVRQIDLEDGRVESLELRGFSYEVNGGRLDLGGFIVKDLDAASLLSLVDDAERMGREPRAADIFDAFGISAIELQDFALRRADGTQTSLGALIIDSFRHDDGIPTGLRISATGIVQSLPPEVIAQGLQAAQLPIALDVPEEIESRAEILYDLDPETDRMQARVTSWDSYSGVELDLSVAVLGLSPVFDALAAGIEPGPDIEAGIGLGSASLTLIGDSWGPPQAIAGRPGPRLFALNFLNQRTMPPALDAALMAPVRAFLESGGALTLTLAPDQPLNARRFRMLGSLAPDQALRRAGLSATHEQR